MVSDVLCMYVCMHVCTYVYTYVRLPNIQNTDAASQITRRPISDNSNTPSSRNSTLTSELRTSYNNNMSCKESAPSSRNNILTSELRTSYNNNMVCKRIFLSL